MSRARSRGNKNKRVATHKQKLADEHEYDLRQQAKRQRIVAGYVSAITNIAASIISFGGKVVSNHQGRMPGAKTKTRERLDVEKHINAMDEKYFRRRYRMNKESFWNLLDIIKDDLPSTGEVRKRGAVPNGPITHSARLSMALRIAAGGDPLDIASLHGVNDDDPMDSFWEVVDAIHRSSQLDLKFPDTHEEQTRHAEEFKDKSDIGICHCLGAIDGILIWIHMPTDSDCKSFGFGPLEQLVLVTRHTL